MQRKILIFASSRSFFTWKPVHGNHKREKKRERKKIGEIEKERKTKKLIEKKYRKGGDRKSNRKRKSV